MAIDKPPAYQMYARDWLGSRSVRLMEDFQRGWYIQLLNEAWDNDPQGMLPNDQEMLMRLAGITEERRSEPRFNRCWSAVMDRFKQDGAWVYNERQLEQVVKQTEFRDSQSVKGKKSAEKRAAMKALLQNANNGSTTVQPESNHGSTEGQPKVNSPIPTPSPIPSPVKDNGHPPVRLYCWDKFAAIYPKDGLTYDTAGKAWWAKNVKWGDDALVDAILAGVRRWNAGSWHQKGIVANCAKFLRERAFEKPVPGDAADNDYARAQAEIFRGMENA